MRTLFILLLLAGCNEPVKHETKTYTGDSDWLRINKLVTDLEKNDFERCIKDKSTCHAASVDVQNMVRSLEK